MTETHDIADWDTDEGPYRHYAALRERGRVFWSDRLQRWFLTRYEDVSRAYRDPETFSSNNFALRGASRQLDDPAQDRVAETFQKQILLLDKPEHTRLRRLVSHAFTPRSVTLLRSQIDRTARHLLDSQRMNAEFDFVSQFAGPLPLIVIGELLGIAVPDRDQYRRWSDDLAAVTEPNQSEDAVRAAFHGADEMRAYLTDLVEDRRGALDDDLVSRLITADEAGDRLTTEEIVAMAMIITSAGHETTTSLLTHCLLLLLGDRDAAKRIASDTTFRTAAVEETLRYEPPLQFGTRVLTRELQLDDVTIPAGSPVALSVAAANRDPRRFADPERFDPDREPVPHVSFGLGAHFCLGASLARLEADVVLGVVSADYPDLVPTRDVTRKTSPLFRGFTDVAVRWAPGHWNLPASR